MEAPEIPGLSFVNGLGAGGFADVYLYDQLTPARRVAVKVLRPEVLGDGGVERFTAEVNAMAQLEHPHIVPIFWVADTAAGDPYFAMMYYSRGNLAERVRRRPFGVSEVLAVGVQLCGALETAHRSGILHRDIKPANVLVNQFGTIGLTDFGIASRLAASDADQSFSVPWSAPEVLDGTSSGSISSDVYGLAATLWHLLVGRSPFVVPGGDNASDALTDRVLSLPAPSTDLDDVPIGLDRLLRGGLAKDPAERPKTMLEFARSLQAVEKAGGWPPTQLVLAADDATSLVRAQITQIAPLGGSGSKALADAAPVTAPPPDWALPGHGEDALAKALSDFSDAELSGGTAPVPPSALTEPPSDTVRRGPAAVAPENDQVEPSPGPLSTPEASPGLEGGEAADEDGDSAAPDTYLPPNPPGRVKLASSPAVSPDTVVHQPRSIGFRASPGEPPYPAHQEEGAPTGDHASLETVLRPAPALAETRLVAPNRQPSWRELDDRANQPDGPGTVRVASPPVSPASPPPAGGSVPPEPSSDRRRPRIGRRGRLLGVAAVVVGLALVMGLLVLTRADQQSAAPSTGGTPPSASPKADMTRASLLRAGDLTAGVGGTWRAIEGWPVVVCLPGTSGASTSATSASFTASWLHGIAAHRVELFETKEAAAQAFAMARAALGGCSTPDMLYIANGWAISSLGQQAVGVSYIVQGKTSVYHTVLLIRSGRMLNWLDLGRQKTAITGQQALVVARNLLRHQSGDSAAGPTPGSNSRIGMSQPLASNSPGQILPADFPQIPGSKSAWSMYTTSAVDNDGARVLCDEIAVSKTKGARMRLAQGWVTSVPIWIDAYALDFSKADAARGFYRRLQSNLSTCEGSNLFVTPFRGLDVSTDRGLARGGWIKGQFTDRKVRFVQATFLVGRRVVFIQGEIDPTVATGSAQIDAIVERLVKRSGEIPW